MVMALDPDIEAKYTQNRKVMVASGILLVILILVIIFFHIFYRFYRRHRLRQLSHHLPTTANSSFTTNEASLDPSVLKTLPIFTYTSVTNAPLNECAVCLTEFADGDEGRLLPNCKHAFHRQCIDTWFGSNSTCPLCRALVQRVMGSIETELDSGSGSEAGEGCSSSFPEPVWCPRKPLSIIVEVPQEERGSDLVPGDQGLKWSLKRFCSV